MDYITSAQVEKAIEDAINMENRWRCSHGFEDMRLWPQVNKTWDFVYKLVEHSTIATLRAVDVRYQQYVSKAISLVWNKGVL